MQDHFDIVAIGDTVTDAFIRIQQASVLRTEDAQGTVSEELCLINGAKIPYEFAKVIAGVGNSANAAVSSARLGLRTAFVTDVGGDDFGREIIAAMGAQGVDPRFIRTHDGKVTNYHYVLWHNAERTILIKHEDYPYTLPDIGSPRWLYLSSLGGSSLDYHTALGRWLAEHPDTKLAFQPGTFQMKMGTEALKDIYAHTEVFFCNVEEARIILRTNEPDPAKLPRMMSELGPKISVITDGPNGLYAFDAATSRTFFMPPYPDPKPPYERTGAGDACSSTITAALALGKSVEEALAWGPINSMSVVQYVGAQEGLLSREKLEEYLSARPEDYVPKQIA
jgi:sugar/nucleoside kinase (ribokinase family)